MRPSRPVADDYPSVLISTGRSRPVHVTPAARAIRAQKKTTDVVFSRASPPVVRRCASLGMIRSETFTTHECGVVLHSVASVRLSVSVCMSVSVLAEIRLFKA